MQPWLKSLGVDMAARTTQNEIYQFSGNFKSNTLIIRQAGKVQCELHGFV